MIVVEVQDDGIERQALVAAHRAAAPHVLETIEQAIEARTNRVRVMRERIRAFVRGAKRARATGVREVLPKCLGGPPPRAFGNRFGEFDLIGARHLMHDCLFQVFTNP